MLNPQAPKKLRILMLNYEFPPLGGGAGNATYYILKEFSKNKDLEIDLVTSSVNNFRIEKFSKNITIHYFEIGKKGNLHYQTNKDLLKYSWKAYSYAKELIKKNNYHLCHAFFGIPCGYIAMKLKKKFGLNYIVSLRGSDVPFYNSRFYLLDKLVFKKLSRKVWRSAKQVIANSKGLKDLALGTNPNQKIIVIYNGVNTEEFKPSKTKKKNKVLKLISTGRLIERKGYSYLINALENQDNIELTLIGDGNLRNELESLSKELNVNVRFPGKKNKAEIIKELQNSDIFILPSLNEGMSNSILEAMACGLPIITTDTGGSEELIDGNGFIVKKEDSINLFRSLEKYRKDPILVAKHGKLSRDLALQLSWNKTVSKYSSIYQK